VHLSSSQTFSGHLGLLKTLIILHLFGHLRLRDVKHVSFEMTLLFVKFRSKILILPLSVRSVKTNFSCIVYRSIVHSPVTTTQL
jgi:hypothetical protein